MSSPDRSSQTVRPKAERQLDPGLYMIATPIGNLGDITLRALESLQAADVIACEDTRVTARLLAHYAIRKPLVRYDDHADEEAGERLLDRCRSEVVALVSDAGTPLVSDPGYRLVLKAREHGIAVTSLPGPCAAVTALTLSALPTDRFLFAGFLPVKEKARRAMIEEVAGTSATLVFYDTAPRLTKSLAAIAELFPDRTVAVARELTKLYEECRTGPAAELLAHYQSHPPKGEIVLLVGPGREETPPGKSDALLRGELQRAGPSQAARTVAALTGLDRSSLYARAIELQRE